MEVGWYREVSRWCLGENDKFGTCAFAAIGNLHVLVTSLRGFAEVFTDGEIEFAYGQMEGFSPLDEKSDHGAQLADVLRYWDEWGWPGDPTLRPVSWQEIGKRSLPLGVWTFGGVYAWLLGPEGDETIDFSDAALDEAKPGKLAHAVLIVGASETHYTLVTWGETIRVSREWWDRYGRESYGVLHPKWQRPIAAMPQ